MDTFKIIVIVFMIFTTYLLYKLYADKYYREDFEGTAQNVGGVDDTNAINTLAQIAKNLMAGGVTVPGNMIVKGGSIATGDAPGQTPGTIVSNMGDSWGMLWGSNCALIGQKGKTMRFGFADAYNAAGWDEKMNIQPDGTVNIKGRNILAELDAIKNHLGRLDGEIQGRKNEINWLNNNTVRMDRQYYIDIGVRANGDGCCGNGGALAIHGGGNGAATAWQDKSVASRLSFRQV
jgi:hypothetical protein